MGDTSVMINLKSLMDDAKCFATVRDMRWPDGVMCPHCDSPEITKQGHDDTQPERQRYLCKSCERRFDDLTPMEGFWSLLRSWLRPHRGLSQVYLPLYLGFFEFVHNVRRRGKALLGSILELLLT